MYDSFSCSKFTQCNSTLSLAGAISICVTLCFMARFTDFFLEEVKRALIWLRSSKQLDSSLNTWWQRVFLCLKLRTPPLVLFLKVTTKEFPTLFQCHSGTYPKFLFWGALRDHLWMGFSEVNEQWRTTVEKLYSKLARQLRLTVWVPVGGCLLRISASFFFLASNSFACASDNLEDI